MRGRGRALVGCVASALALSVGCSRSTPAPEAAWQREARWRTDAVDMTIPCDWECRSSVVRHCVLGHVSNRARCTRGAHEFAHDLLHSWRQDPDDFDCRMALVAARRFAPEESARLVELCCPLEPFYARDDDGAALCPRESHSARP
jgi:hypothetical protein